MNHKLNRKITASLVKKSGFNIFHLESGVEANGNEIGSVAFPNAE